MTKPINIMFDIETLSTEVNAIITNIGACVFDIEKKTIGNTYYKCINWINQLNEGRHFSPFTLKWWMSNERSMEAREEVVKMLDNLNVCLREFNNYAKNFKTTPEDEIVIWCDANFDMPILINAYKQYGIEIPFRYNSVRDARTIEKLIAYFDPNYEFKCVNKIPHHALYDAIYQAEQVIEVYDHIQLKKEK